MSNETKIRRIGDLVARVRYPEGPGETRLLLLLHGWTGDENSMWIFSSRIPKNYLLIAPRGITRTPLGGFGWQEAESNAWPNATNFKPAVEKILSLLDNVDFPGIDPSKFDLMGFSQGAALAFVVSFSFPERIGKLAGLSGFLPDGLNDKISKSVLQGKKVFIAHGSHDEMVPIDKGREVVQALKAAKAEVVYCEEDVGHKLSSGCFRGLNEYFDQKS
jgi:phospholipase/carboxylesterase